LASVVVVHFLGGRRSPPSTRSPPTHPPTHLDAQQDLFDCDGGAPALVLVQYAEADSARGVNVGVEELVRQLALQGRGRGKRCRCSALAVESQ
jgi:hypothetical protein